MDRRSLYAIVLLCGFLLDTSVCVVEIPVPDGALLPVRNAGVDTIMAVVQKLNTDLTNAVNEFKPINTSCMQKLDNAIPLCSSCVKSKCEARGKKVCAPNKWEEILGKTIEAIKDVPDFLFKQVPDVVFKELPDKLIDVTKDIHEFLKDKVIDNVVDVSKKLHEGVIDISKGLGKGVLDLGEKTIKEIGRVGERIGKEAGRVLESAGKEVGRFGEKIGKEIGRAFDKIFGKRSAGLSATRLLARSRRSEPGCGTFENNPSQACKTYLQPQFCPSCSFNPAESCDGYAGALQKIEAAEKAREWLMTVANNDYNLLSMTFSMDTMGQFVNVKATVSLFGKQFSVNVGSVNPYLPHVSGPAIANKALQMYKNSV